MYPLITHPWQVSSQEALRIQENLVQKLNLNPTTKQVELIAGTDVSYNKHCNLQYAGVIIFTFPDLQIVEKSHAVIPCSFPYIPGLLSFREIPALLKAFARLQYEPDLIVCDGQGIAHPRRLGIATHLGIIFDKPAIGCAKTRLCGEYQEPDIAPGSYSNLYHNNQIIGAVLRTRYNVKPLFISPGHRIDLAQSLKIILTCHRGRRLPEITRQAHLYVNELRSSH